MILQRVWWENLSFPTFFFRAAIEIIIIYFSEELNWNLFNGKISRTHFFTLLWKIVRLCGTRKKIQFSLSHFHTLYRAKKWDCSLYIKVMNRVRVKISSKNFSTYIASTLNRYENIHSTNVRNRKKEILNSSRTDVAVEIRWK